MIDQSILNKEKDILVNRHVRIFFFTSFITFSKVDKWEKSLNPFMTEAVII